MTVTNVEKDPTTLTMKITADLKAPLSRVWQLWEDPRQLERWWGPPTYPATFVEHDLTPGSIVTYFMTGPDGDQPKGWWRITAVDAPNSLEFENGLAEHPGAPTTEFPSSAMRVDLVEYDGGTRMTIVTTFPTTAAMELYLGMGMEEGMKGAMGQLDDILGEMSRP